VILRPLTLAAACVLAGLLAVAAAPSTAHLLACTTAEGSVSGYLPAALHTCASLILVGDPLEATETLQTGTGGQLTFKTTHLFRCRESASSSDRVLPSVSVALLHLRGSTWCNHHKGDPKTTLKTRNATISTTGTIVGLVTTGKGTTIKLASGGAVVTTAQGARIVVPQSRQLLIPLSGKPGKPAKLVLTPDDLLAIQELQDDVVAMGPAQTAQQLKSRQEKASVIVGDTTDSAAKLAEFTTAPSARLTAAQVQGQPALVRTELARSGAGTVFLVGPTDLMAPLWHLLRSQGQLPPTAALIYVPM
jgi:hypothetical protein